MIGHGILESRASKKRLDEAHARERVIWLSLIRLCISTKLNDR